MASENSGFSTGLQISLELTNLIPVRKVFDASMEFIRSFRNSGSDIVVEEDLTAIFGRGNIEPMIERAFKDRVQQPKNDNKYKVRPLYFGSLFGLDAEIGPTVSRALTPDRREYLSTIIQLSMLSWMHNRAYLASALGQAAQRRFRQKFPGAIPDPGFDGISGVLEACSSQTTSFT
jgi:hypothetical protein